MGKVLNLEREVGVPALSLVSYMTLHFAITEYRLGDLTEIILSHLPETFYLSIKFEGTRSTLEGFF